VATAKWVQLFAVDMFRLVRAKGQMGQLVTLIQKEPKLQKFLKEYQQLVGL